jgi:thiol-disulfide isomerase/thioredoxin
MRIALVFLTLLSISSAACSRDENEGARAAARASAIANAQSALGPIADATNSAADPVSSAAPVADQPSALPVIDGETLQERIRRSGKKAVVINAFASWCDPCREELPLLNAAAPKLAAKGVAVWLVSMDNPEDVPQAKAELESLSIALPAFAAAPHLAEFKAAVNPRWPGMIPSSFLFDGVGKLRYFWAGEVYEKELMPIVDGLLAGKHIDGMTDFGHAPGATQPGHD